MRSFRSFILSFFLCLVFSLSVDAQTHYSSRIWLGAKAGVEMSQMFFNPSIKQKLAIGTTAGVTFRYIEENHFGLQAEVVFAQRGWKYNFEDAPYAYSRSLNYIDIPVMAHIYFGRRARFFFNAGPQISFLLGESAKSNFDTGNLAGLPDFPDNSRTNTQFYEPVHNSVDYGIVGAIGGEFNINSRNIISLEARFYYGLGNIYRSERQQGFRASNQMGISATLGYWFRIK